MGRQYHSSSTAGDSPMAPRGDLRSRLRLAYREQLVRAHQEVVG